MANDRTYRDVSPLFTDVQLLPLLVDKKTPPEVAAKTLLPLMAMDCTLRDVSPLFTAVQLLPLLVDKKIPSLIVPA